MPTVRVHHQTEAGPSITTPAPDLDPSGRSIWLGNWGEDRAGASTSYRLTRFAVPTRGNGRSESLLQTPEMLIFALGLAALLSLIVFTCDMLSTGEFRPMSVLVFVAAGSYCVVLIRRQRVLAAAERAMMLEIGHVVSVEPAPRVLGKEERRELLNYFKYTPPGGEQGSVPTGGEAKPGGVGAALGGGFPVHSPPPSTHDITESCADGVGVVSGDDRVWVDVEAQMSTPSTTREASGSSQDLESPQFCHERFTEQPSTPASTEGATLRGLSPSTTIGSPCVEDTTTMRAPASEPESAKSPNTTVSGGEKLDRTGATQRSGCTETAVETSGTSGDVIGDLGDLESGTAGKEFCLDKEETKMEDDLRDRRVARGNSWQWSTAGACIVCFGEYRYGDDLCRLPCRHVYHAQCIDEWLDGANHAWCPLCKRDLLSGEEGSEAGGWAPSIANASTDTQNGNRGY